MSAYLDKSQGITFVYSNIHELYLKAKNAKLDSPFEVPRVSPDKSRVFKAGEVQVESFKPRDLKTQAGERPLSVPVSDRDREDAGLRQSLRSVSNLQKNLNELNSAQDRLRFLLQELEDLTNKKKS